MWLLLGAWFSQSVHAQQVNPPIVIRQVYGGGGNAGATYTNDFIELVNVSAAAVSLAGLSVQYASATGTGNFGANSGQLTVLPAVMLQPGQAFLVQEASGGSVGAAMPSADVTGTINLSATAGKVALVDGAASLGCNGGSAPCGASQLAQIIDLVGFGNANFFEGAGAAPTLSSSLAALRTACADSNNNAADFTAAGPQPHNMASGTSLCGAPSGDIGACGDAAAKIYEIQGNGAASPLAGTTINVEGVVIADYRATSLAGLYIQSESGQEDGDSSTSEGLFVYSPPSTSLAVGDRVRVRGQVAEFNNLTELSGVTNLLKCASGASVTPASITLPVSALADFERYEGMLVAFTQPLTVTGNFDWGRFGSLDLSAGGRLFQPTHVVAPGAPAVALQSLNDRSRIILDDVDTSQDPAPVPYKDANNTRRVGDIVPALTGILEERFAAYRIQPVGPVTFQSGNPRPSVPSVGGRLRVVSSNVLNLFKDIGTNCGPSGDLECRGCSTAAECTRQLQKLVNALSALEPDIAGLTEMENDLDSRTTQWLVDALNAAPASPGDYEFIHTGAIGTDAIRVALLYRTSKVTPVKAYKVLDHTFDARFIDTKNRPALAQTFAEVGHDGKFTIVLNHLKSKGSDCNDVSDPDLGDGQGNCNLTRTKAAQVLLDWIATDPTQSGDPDFVVMGDLNAYALEQPIATLKSGGLKSLLDEFAPGGYSYQFEGQSGALDHALVTPSLLAQISGAAEFHSNADEPVWLDYNTEFKVDDPFNSNDPYRSSDHDAIVFGLDLAAGGAASVPAHARLHSSWLFAALLALGAVLARGRARRR